jgi:hypothetical protein
LIQFKVAFGVHHLAMISHYSALWREFDSDDFAIVLHGDLNFVEHYDVFRVFTENIFSSAYCLQNGLQFGVLVTNHVHACPLQLGKINILFSYSAGLYNAAIDADYTHRYDAVMCFGPLHSERYQKKYPNLVVFQMGCPRYDPFYSRDTKLSRQLYADRFGLDPRVPTLCWMPTMDIPFNTDEAFGLSLNSLNIFLERVTRLRSRFNILIKPHPLSITKKEPGVLKAVELFGDKVILDPAADYLPLHIVGDIFLFDYGGAMFGAIHNNLSFGLLNMPEAHLSPDLGDSSLDLQLRQYFPSANPDDDSLDNLVDLLVRDPAQIRANRALLRRQVYAPFYGFAARMAVEFLDGVRRYGLPKP